MRTNLRVEMVNPNRFYTYAYLREDRTPYYIGKGNGRRIYENKGRPCGKPNDKSRIIFLKQNLTEEEAFRHEIYMIAVFGRKDLGIGILHNKTDGGEGTSGWVASEETKRKQSRAMKGKYDGKMHPNYGNKLTEEHRKKLSVIKKGKNNPNYGKRGKNSPNYGENSSNYGKKWWNDSKGNTKFAKECPGENWIAGRGKIKT